MKQIVIFSGKGGTGKTSFAASLAALAENSVFADCDVDAANLHLIMKPEPKEEHLFLGGKIAFLEGSKCTGCEACIEPCRFDAIAPAADGGNRAIVEINPFVCEGCGVCARICPEGAINMKQSEAGYWYVADTPYGPLVFAELKAGEENSGKLVSEVRKKSKEIGESLRKNYCIIDGPPGTGCAVMASLTGTDMAVLVTEPTLSGIHDMDRALQVADFFSIPTGVVVNKASINEENTQTVMEHCRKKSIPFLGTIDYSRKMVDAVSALIPYVDYADDEISDSIKQIWDEIQKVVSKNGGT